MFKRLATGGIQSIALKLQKVAHKSRLQFFIQHSFQTSIDWYLLDGAFERDTARRRQRRRRDESISEADDDDPVSHVVTIDVHAGDGEESTDLW